MWFSGTPAIARRCSRCAGSASTSGRSTPCSSRITRSTAAGPAASFDADELQNVIDGIGAIGMLARCNAVLSGYLGATEQARAVVEIVKTVKAVNPRALFFCDPVMGATGGCTVEPGIQDFLVTTMPEVADAMMPNHIELEKLVGRHDRNGGRSGRRVPRGDRARAALHAGEASDRPQQPRRYVQHAGRSARPKRGSRSGRCIRSRGSRWASAI